MLSSQCSEYMTSRFLESRSPWFLSATLHVQQYVYSFEGEATRGQLSRIDAIRTGILLVLVFVVFCLIIIWLSFSDT